MMMKCDDGNAADTILPSFRTLSSQEGHHEKERKGGHLNGFLGVSLNDMNIIFLVILLDKTVSVG